MEFTFFKDTGINEFIICTIASALKEGTLKHKVLLPSSDPLAFLHKLMPSVPSLKPCFDHLCEVASTFICDSEGQILCFQICLEGNKIAIQSEKKIAL